MSPKIKTNIINSLLVLLILSASFGISVILQDVFDISEHITTLFVFAVFLVSLITDGYLYGIISTFIAVLAINYAFTYPYFDIDFTIPANLISAIAMLVLSILTSTFTTKLKKWQAVKSESEKERMRANLLRAVSHDLRTPLTTIYGASSSIVENYEKFNDAQKLQMISGIKEDSEWLVRIVENLLSVTKFDGGNVKLIKVPTVLEELIDTVIIKFRKKYPWVKIEIDIPDELVLIPMDAILIEQVIFNILENTIHHAKDFTKINFRVFVIASKAIFEISDDGCGIAKEKLATVFSGYEYSTNDIADGQKRNAGIGLSVCASIIKAHDGKITAENQKSGGALFRFSLDTEDFSSDEQ